MRAATAGAFVCGLLVAGCGAGAFSPRDAARERLAAREAEELDAAPGESARAAVARKYAVLDRALEAGAPVAYHPREAAAVKQVFDAYGPLYAAATPDAEQLELTDRPWAGYWYPLAKTDLWGTADSPLAKLDLVLASLGRLGGVVAWERENHGGIPHASWEGFCAAWSVAATSTPEPTRALVYRGVLFRPSDLKGLLTKANELTPTTIFGVRYDGDAASDGTYQDLRPEAFHRLILRRLGEEKRALLLDTDPGAEVWSKPIFRYRWLVKDDPEHPDALLVTAFPWYVGHRGAESDRPTGDGDVLAGKYDYRLWVDRQTQRDGKFLVVAGEWLGASFQRHPDYVAVPAPDGAWGSVNTALNASLDVVREVLVNGTPQ